MEEIFRIILPQMLLLVVLPIIIVLIFMYFRHGRAKKQIAFVGPRGSGKTRTLFKICENLDVKTVPTVEEHELCYKGVNIKEQIPCNAEDMYLKYNILEKDTIYFFFINSLSDIYEFKGFEVKFVYFGQKEDLAQNVLEKSDVIFLNGDPTKLISFIDKTLRNS